MLNRRERRMAKALQRRKTDRFVPLGKLPERIQNHPMFQAGQRVEFPPGYYALIEETTELARRWVREHPEAELRWLEQKGDAFIAMALPAWAPYFADSEDAFRLLEWLDEQTGRQLSFNQVHWALALAGIVSEPAKGK